MYFTYQDMFICGSLYEVRVAKFDVKSYTVTIYGNGRASARGDVSSYVARTYINDVKPYAPRV